MLAYDYISLLASHLQAVKLYERCLIPCANYSEFWIRYAEYVDAKGGREIANYALGRASSCFVKVSSIGILFCLLHLLLLSLLVAVAACIRNLHSSVSTCFAKYIEGGGTTCVTSPRRMHNSLDSAVSKIVGR